MCGRHFVERVKVRFADANHQSGFAYLGLGRTSFLLLHFPAHGERIHFKKLLLLCQDRLVPAYKHDGEYED